MAIDTRDKRASALAMVGMMYHLPLPDASVDAPDRAQVTWAYSGLSYIVVVPPDVSYARPSFEVELYDRYGSLKAFLTNRCVVQWEWNRVGGCGQSDVVVSSRYGSALDVAMAPEDEVRVKISNQLRYSGKIARLKRTVKKGGEAVALTFYGYVSELREPMVKATYENMELSAIVKNILDTYVVGTKRVTYSSADVQETDYAVASITFNHTVMDAIQLLANLAGNIEWGVDRNKAFFWKIQDDTVRRIWTIGKETMGWEENEDYESIKNRLFVYGSDGVSALADIQASDSIDQFGSRQDNLFESSISEVSDATRLGLSVVKNQASRKRQVAATITQSDLFLESSLPIGAAVIKNEPFSTLKFYGQDKSTNIRYGQRPTLSGKYGNFRRDQIDSIRYQIAGGGMVAQVVLSGTPPSVGTLQKRVEFEVKDLQRR